MLLRALVWLPATAAGVRLLGHKRWSAISAFVFPLAKVCSSPREETIRAAVAMLNLASARGIHAGNCLTRSEVLCALLRRGGVPCTLRIGARVASGSFAAHAWVECDGAVLNDASEVVGRFTPFDDSSTMRRSESH
jgi:hypothetical protein